MGSCTRARLCSTDTGLTKMIAPVIIDPATDELLCLWSEVPTPQVSPRWVRFARFNTTTKLPNSEVVVEGDGSTTQLGRSPRLLRLSTGVLIALYNNAGTATVRAKESTDGGATWGTGVDISSAAQSTIQGAFVCPDDTVFVLCGNPSVSAGKVRSYKRTGVATWAAGVLVFDNDAGAGTGDWDSTLPIQVPNAMWMSSATAGFMVGWRSADGSTSPATRLTALVTADGWASAATKVTIDTLSADGTNTALHSVQDSTGRIYIMYHDVAANKYRPKLAYTDDYGTTWTLIGTPSAISAAWANDVDPTYDSFLCIDAQDYLLYGFSSVNTGTQPYKHFVFRGKADASGHLLDQTCDYSLPPWQWSTSSTGTAIYQGQKIQRAAAHQTSVGSGFDMIVFLDITTGVPEEPTEPPLVPPAPQTGADDNNMLLRIDMEEGRGWSMHPIPVACFLSWDEGDAETGREVPILLYGSPSMDPAIQDATLIPAFSRMEQENNYGRRVYVDASTDQQVVRYDPYRMVIRSKEFTVAGDFDRNVIRGILMTYTYDAPADAVLPVTLVIDGVRTHTVEFGTTYGKQETYFRPISTWENVGNKVQFEVDETSLWPLSIDTWGLKIIRKRVRG